MALRSHWKHEHTTQQVEPLGAATRELAAAARCTVPDRNAHHGARHYEPFKRRRKDARQAKDKDACNDDTGTPQTPCSVSAGKQEREPTNRACLCEYMKVGLLPKRSATGPHTRAPSNSPANTAPDKIPAAEQSKVKASTHTQW